MENKNINVTNKPVVAVKAAAAPTPAAPVAVPAPANLKKGPAPVFSIPATEADKTFVALQSDRTGKTQKELITMALASARKQIEALPKYVEPITEVKVKVKKATEAEAVLATAGATK
jgi:hypothetical protein